MTEWMLISALNNACLSAVLALAAWAVQRRGTRPGLAYGLWLLVIVKLLTPPLLSLPMIELPGLIAAEAPQPPMAVELPPIEAPAEMTGAPVVVSVDVGEQIESTPISVGWPSVLLALWALGSLLVLCVSAWRIARFDRALRRAAQPVEDELQRIAEQLARDLGLRRCPQICTTSAHISPLVWWVGGPVRVVLPQGMARALSRDELRWILAHELAHVRRRDHIVRWVEWLACLCFWWNPIAWLARRHLRVNEELCCDAFVLTALQANPMTYANSLLRAVEFLAIPALRPPAVASGINSGGSLERRFQMIVSNRVVVGSRWASAVVLLCAIGLLPLSVAFAQDPNYDAVSRRLIAAVQAGELSAAQAEQMMGALARARFAEQLASAGDKRGHRAHGGRQVEPSAKSGLSREHLIRLKKKLAASGLKGERVGGALEAIVKLAHLIRTKQLDKHEAAMAKHLGSLHLNEAQRDIVWGAAKWLGAGGKKRERGIVDHFSELGVKEEQLGRIKAAMVESGMKGQQMEGSFGALLRLVHAMREKDRKSIGQVKEYLSERLRLDEKQLKLILGLAERLAHQAHKTAERRGLPDEARMGRVKRQLEAAVKAGKLTKAQARVTWEEYVKKVKDAHRHSAQGAADGKASAYREIQAALKAGKITPEQAEQWMRKVKEKFGPKGAARKKGKTSSRKPSEAEMIEVKKTIWAAVRAGHLTDDQAKKRWAAYVASIRERQAKAKRAAQAAEAREREFKAEYAAHQKRIRAAVEAGKMTEEEGAHALQVALRRLMDSHDAALRERSAKLKRAARAKAMREARAKEARERELEAEYAAHQKRIHAAVEAGKMTEAEATRALKQLRRRLTGNRTDKR